MAEENPAPSQPQAPPAVSGAVGLVLIALVGVAIGSFLTGKKSPDSGGTVAEARLLAAKGERAKAVSLLEPLAGSEDESAARDEARDELARLAEAVTDSKVPLAEATAVLEAALDAQAPIVSGTIGLAVRRVADEAAKDPRGASALATALYEHVVATPELRFAREKALAARFALDEKDLEARIDLAEAELDAGDTKQARERLEPIAKELGSGEGARVLGLARVHTDAPEEAYDLLKAYYDAHLDAFTRAAEGLRSADQLGRTQAGKDIHDRNLPAALKRSLEMAASDDERNKLMDAWVRERTRRSQAMRRALRALPSMLRLATAGIELGSIELKRAADRSPIERRAHLAAAERYWVSVLEVAANDERLLFIARARFDLGREKEAQEALEEVIRRHGRTGEALLGVALSFERAAGARETVGQLAEEAWGKLAPGELKDRAAVVRGRMADSTTETIAWLERATPTEPVTAMLDHARAKLAREEGRFEDSVKLIDQALAFYSKDDAAAPDQLGSLRLERFAASGDPADLDACIATLEKAAAPADASAGAIELLADALSMRAVLSVVKPRLRTDVLREVRLELLHYAATDEKDLAQLAASFAAHPDHQRSLALHERTVAVDPTFADGWSSLFQDASARRDVAAVTSVLHGIEGVPIDRTADARGDREYWAGEKDALYRESTERRRKQTDAILGLARAAGDTATTARALCARAAVERDAVGWGATADLDLAVKLAEEAEKLAPRPATRLALESSLAARALGRAARSNAALAAIVKKHGKLGAVPLLALAARSDGALADALAADEDVKRAASMIPEDGEPGTEHVSLARLARLGSLPGLEKALAASELELARARASRALSPESPEHVLELWTLLVLRGSKDEAAALIDSADKEGVPLPDELMLGARGSHH